MCLPIQNPSQKQPVWTEIIELACSHPSGRGTCLPGGLAMEGLENHYLSSYRGIVSPGQPFNFWKIGKAGTTPHATWSENQPWSIKSILWPLIPHQHHLPLLLCLLALPPTCQASSCFRTCCGLFQMCPWLPHLSQAFQILYLCPSGPAPLPFLSFIRLHRIIDLEPLLSVSPIFSLCSLMHPQGCWCLAHLLELKKSGSAHFFYEEPDSK